LESSRAGNGQEGEKSLHVQISGLFSIEICDRAVMDFLAATEVRKFPHH
jgi:hypothetical protein